MSTVVCDTAGLRVCDFLYLCRNDTKMESGDALGISVRDGGLSGGAHDDGSGREGADGSYSTCVGFRNCMTIV